MKLKTASLVAVLFVMSSGALAEQRGDRAFDERLDSIPLRNWNVVIPAELRDPQSGRLMIGSDANLASPQTFTPVTPCRIVDTRGAAGTYGGPSYAAGNTRSYNVPANPACTGIPIAAAYSLNFTIVSYNSTLGPSGFITAYPTGTARPTVSTVNFGNGTNAVANAAIVPVDAAGSFDVFSSGSTHLIIDINGYFGRPANAAYGRVTSTGALLVQTLGESPNFNLVDANIEHPATGVYCIGGLNFTPLTGTVTHDGTGLTAATANVVASLTIFRGPNLSGCGAGFQQARVFLTSVNDTAPPAAVDGSFVITLGR